MWSLARISFAGQVASDGEIKTSEHGAKWAVASATFDVERDNGDYETKPEPMLVELVAFGDHTEQVSALEKGQPVDVIGRFERRSWIDETGERRQKWRCLVEAILAFRMPRNDVE